MKSLRVLLSGLLATASIVLRIVAATLWLFAFVLLVLASPVAALVLGRLSMRRFRF
jgi:hypothetical protein